MEGAEGAEEAPRGAASSRFRSSGGRSNAKGACGPGRGARGQLISECGSDLISYRARCDSSLSSSFDSSLCALGKTEQVVAGLKIHVSTLGRVLDTEQQVRSPLLFVQKEITTSSIPFDSIFKLGTSNSIFKQISSSRSKLISGKINSTRSNSKQVIVSL